MSTEQIERIAKVLHDQFMEDQGFINPRYDLSAAKEVYRENARAVIAAIHPTVRSAEELDALPEGTVLLDSGTEVLQLVEGGDGLQWSDSWANECSVQLPAKILHIPGGAA